MSYPPLILAWGKERFHFQYDDSDLTEMTLAQFKEICREMTGVPVTSMKLIFSGATMKDDVSPLIYYGVYPGALVRMMGSIPKPGQAVVSELDMEQHAIMEKFDHIMSETSDLVLQKIRGFLSNTQIFIDQFLSENSAIDFKDAESIIKSERKTLFDSYTYISEILMKRLLIVDGVVLPQGADNARQQRKKIVRQIQSWMNQIDEAKTRVLDLEKAKTSAI
ncbi:BAG family molecular chaperone regulator 1 [Smittium culicis]|uniref:BAG family molecular chaperone regulator 1 n=1 Tax=Smittium culicis TaxID=133412 RepID=A0A1R1XX51_9FUNG|nr:BAG family molecular chaperone regulator 1 [Smittium culicis]OMJ19188.1 BAG family molecular chaperone regulator 1 [Smittium culicis]